MTAPETVTQRVFAKTLGRVVARPVFLAIPSWPLRTALGEMSDLLLEGQRTVSTKAEAAGFRFTHAGLEPALRDLLVARQAPLTVHYNAACPVCEAEISHYRRVVKAHHAPVAFSDIGSQPDVLAAHGVSDRELVHRMHVSMPGGEIASGVDAFIAIWRRLPGYRWLAQLVALPVMRQLFSTAYEWLAVPLLAAWNARRDRRHLIDANPQE